MTPYYERGGITIYHGDCREILPSIHDGVDAVLSDPPYPGYQKGWAVPDVGAILASIRARVMAICWPVMTAVPMDGVVSEHVWHKPNGCSAHHYERVLMYGDAGKGCKVFRIAAVLPNYVQYRRECVDHPTQKPVKLMSELVRITKAKNVLDPFMGSGTSLVAAQCSGLTAIGIEIEERYCEIAAKRLEAASRPSSPSQLAPHHSLLTELAAP
jgi:site-specific DNA-methyltransferase (adenine-specific)